MAMNSDPAHLLGYWINSENNYNMDVNHVLEDYYWSTPQIFKYKLNITGIYVMIKRFKSKY